MIPFRFLISLALLSLVAAPAHSTTLAEAAVRTSAFGDITTVLCQDGGFGSVSATATCGQDGNNGHATAYALPGYLGTYASLSSSSVYDDNDNFQAYGWAKFSDALTLGSGLVGPGVSTDARVVFQIDGSVAFSPPDWLQGGTLSMPWFFKVMVGGLELQPSNQPTHIGGEWHYDFDIIPGIPVNFSAELVSDVRCWSCNGPYEGVQDFSNTATFSRMEVRDPGTGEFFDPSAFTITSGEGASYANVVPEPSTALLLACGLVALAARKRQR